MMRNEEVWILEYQFRDRSGEPAWEEIKRGSWQDVLEARDRVVTSTGDGSRTRVVMLVEVY